MDEDMMDIDSHQGYQGVEVDIYNLGDDAIPESVREHSVSQELSSSRGRLEEAVSTREGAARDARRDIEHLDTDLPRRPSTSPRRRRIAHPGRRFDNHLSNSYVPDYQKRGRLPLRLRTDHYSPPRSSFRRPSPSYVRQEPSAEAQLVRAMADLDVRNDDREDRRDRGGGRGGRGGGNNRKRRYDGMLRACAVAITEHQLTNHA